VAARTVLGPKPCSTHSGSGKRRLCSMLKHWFRACRYSLLGLENLPEQIPQELQIVRSDLDDKCHGSAVLRGFVDGLGPMNDWQTRGSDWPPWHVSEPAAAVSCPAVTQASKVHSLSESALLSQVILVHPLKHLHLLCEQHLEVIGCELHLLSWRL
jgi:hypothetical protein